MKLPSLKKPHIILFLIILLASFLRVWKISEIPVSLFGDELDVGYHAYSILKTGRDYQGNFLPLHFHSLAEWRTPLYLYSVVPTVYLFGISPLGVRLPAAIFGILGVWGMYLLSRKLILMFSGTLFEKEKENTASFLGLVSAFIMAINPWHIQYSRAAFEVTQLLLFLIFGLYFFLRSIHEKGKYLSLAVMFLVLTPMIYSTAKLFTPLLMVFLFFAFREDVLRLNRKVKLKAVFTGLILGIPVIYSVLFGGGAQRAGYTSVFTDPTIESEVGFKRNFDLTTRGDVTIGANPSYWDRLFHNKLIFWYENISANYLKSYSFDLLFDDGDPNLRHSPSGIGLFFTIEMVSLIVGLSLFFRKEIDIKLKTLIGFILIFGALPAALTRDGGDHATRLILILPGLLFLISWGLVYLWKNSNKLIKNAFFSIYLLLLTFNFVFYIHEYYVHYPWDSERWWHAGLQGSIQTIKSVDADYDNVIMSMAGEPLWIFFAAWYEYPPDKWQKDFPIGNDVTIEGFGKVSHIDKYHFGKFDVDGKSLYDLPKFIDEKTLYLATAKEIGVNLVREPERTPPGLKLIRAIAYPSGEPAYYLFTLAERS